MVVRPIARKLSRYAWFSAMARTAFVPFDRLVAKVTRGRVVTVGLLPGLMLTTVGRKSGLARTQPLAYFPDGDGIVLIGSNWGGDNHPAWSANLIANPDATAVIKGATVRVHAELATGAERDRLFAIAVRHWPGYEAYVRRAAPRRIRVFRLTTDASRRGARDE
jgi:deazaflavin-dependent oxidoreductase (nitroreductase family)